MPSAIPSLADRREQLSRKFLKQSLNPHLASLPSYLTHGIPQLLPD